MTDTNSVQENSRTTVWVLVIDSPSGGTSVETFASKAALDLNLYDYCDDWWDREFGAETRPDDDQLVAEYWHRMTERGEEWHLIKECQLRGAAREPLGWVDRKGNFFVSKDVTKESFLALFKEAPIGETVLALYTTAA